MEHMIAQGAEARIFENGELIRKERFAKEYRHPLIDEELRGFRTRREAKVMEKLSKIGINTPNLMEMDDTNMIITMENLKGEKLRDVLYKDPLRFGEEMGKNIGLMHSHDIIHGDLTTSNMILSNDRLNFIDFGLSFFSDKIEDKAVDLHLLRQALESKHYEFWEQAFEAVLDGYSGSFEEHKEVLHRLKQVELRGRNKN